MDWLALQKPLAVNWLVELITDGRRSYMFDPHDMFVLLSWDDLIMWCARRFILDFPEM